MAAMFHHDHTLHHYIHKLKVKKIALIITDVKYNSMILRGVGGIKITRPQGFSASFKLSIYKFPLGHPHPHLGEGGGGTQSD